MLRTDFLGVLYGLGVRLFGSGDDRFSHDAGRMGDSGGKLGSRKGRKGREGEEIIFRIVLPHLLFLCGPAALREFFL